MAFVPIPPDPARPGSSHRPNPLAAPFIPANPGTSPVLNIAPPVVISSNMFNNTPVSPTTFENPYTLISTTSELSTVVDLLSPLPTYPPSLYIDLEGINLSRYGSISILTIYASPLRTTYLIDVHTLQQAAFTTPGRVNPTNTLKSLLEDPTVPVVLFDARNDNDALVNNYKVRMAGVVDVQLMELASRPGKKHYLNGLAKVLQSYPIMSPQQLISWKATKDEGVDLFAPEKGGSYEVFNERPLRPEVGRYCVQDVSFLRDLWGLFEADLGHPTKSWRKIQISQEVQKRLAMADDPNYDPKGRERARGPAGWR
ncbi:hypothetical protein H072_7370 [Dactylellina haptotyla CBS 200.50]|uniref:3'-5' exonuclease domain-containing protein n=1 Tax=Dactylellina haptotyla (strain CBS 200.50) TaxID=1284197 RepID=S8BU98_DACHA|nr:hypothetical protein H072_7370 [Dactylellina haptotyla CBS 200.50]